MPYITVKQSPAYHQISFDEILFGRAEPLRLLATNESNTRTYYAKYLNEKFLSRFDIQGMIRSLEDFVSRHDALYNVERISLYDRFYIPKKSGGLREINAPVPELMEALRELKMLFETKMFASYHTSAFAYVPKRSTVDAVKRHQRNESRWFLKTDFSDFFGSTTLGFVMHMLSMIFPFSEIIMQGGRDVLEIALSLCFLNGGLPQGTPISPMLTNLMMIPIDHRLYNCLRDYKGNNYVYTRYADDSIISSRKSFDMDDIIGFINATLAEFKAPFKIKPEKTRYGSRAGSNWNLGLMLNKDNEITIGQKKKQLYRAMVCNYILDRKNDKPWELHDVQVLRGLTNYYHMIEPEYIEGVIKFNNEKFNVNFLRCMKEDLSM